MALVGNQTYPYPIPHEAGHQMVFRPLSGMELDEAQRVGIEKQLRLLSTLTPELVQSVSSGERTPQQQRQQYDKDVLLSKAIVEWSYEEPVSQDNINKLDALTRQWAVDVILDMNVRPMGESTGSVGE